MRELELLSGVELQADPSRTALLLVDMQNDFCVPGFGAEKAGRDIGAARAIIPALQRLLGSAREAGVAVAHVAFWTLPDRLGDSGPWLTQRRKATYSSDRLCLADTPGAEFVEELRPIAGEWQVRKSRYSAFTGTNLDLLLRSRGVQTVVVCGVSTNACVESTFRAAFDLGYYVLVPTDGCASWDAALHEAALANARHRFGATPEVRELIEIWSRHARR